MSCKTAQLRLLNCSWIHAIVAERLVSNGGDGARSVGPRYYLFANARALFARSFSFRFEQSTIIYRAAPIL